MGLTAIKCWAWLLRSVWSDTSGPESDFWVLGSLWSTTSGPETDCWDLPGMLPQNMWLIAAIILVCYWSACDYCRDLCGLLLQNMRLITDICMVYNCSTQDLWLISLWSVTAVHKTDCWDICGLLTAVHENNCWDCCGLLLQCSRLAATAIHEAKHWDLCGLVLQYMILTAEIFVVCNCSTWD